MSDKELKFQCPICNHKLLDQVKKNIFTYISIDSISKDGKIIYNKDSNYSVGDVELYQCANCAYILKTKNNAEVNSKDKLIKWLKNNCKL